MKVVIASDSFKGSLTSMQVADSAAKAVLSVFPDCEVVKVNVADGGEGTVDALVDNLGGEYVGVEVSDPLSRHITARYGIVTEADGGSGKKVAVMEMSAASGLPLLTSSERNPMETSTCGTGEMIMDAIRRGCRKVLIGIGGSATNDGGTGMLSALGYRFLDAGGNVLSGKGGNLEKIVSVDASGVPQSVMETEFTVACDVDTPFCGPDGAAFVFAPQKGAGSDAVKALDRGMTSFARVTSDATGTAISDMPGAGAAGGMGGGFKAYLRADLLPGIEMVLDAIGFDGLIAGSDLIITGEGKIDFQTSKGKTPYGILKRARKQNIPVVALGGKVELDKAQWSSLGFCNVVRTTPDGMDLRVAMEEDVAAENIYRAVRKTLEDSVFQSTSI